MILPFQANAGRKIFGNQWAAIYVSWGDLFQVNSPLSTHSNGIHVSLLEYLKLSVGYLSADQDAMFSCFRWEISLRMRYSKSFVNILDGFLEIVTLSKMKYKETNFIIG